MSRHANGHTFPFHGGPCASCGLYESDYDDMPTACLGAPVAALVRNGLDHMGHRVTADGDGRRVIPLRDEVPHHPV
jgi:hypothetical protein